MSNHTYKVVTLVGTSADGITEAIENGISRARETLHHLDWFEVGEIRGHLSDDGIQHYQVELKVGFRIVEPSDLLRG